MKRIGVILLALAILGWLNSFDGYVFRREVHLFRLQHLGGIGNIGGTPDVWFEKFTVAGEWERLALFFGYTDDYRACVAMVEAWKQQHPDDVYRCNITE